MSEEPTPPALELRIGGLRLTIQRFPAGLVSAITTLAASAPTAWATLR